MGNSTFKRTSITVGKDGAGQDFKAFGDTPGAYIRWDHANNQLLFVGGAQFVFAGAGALDLSDLVLTPDAARTNFGIAMGSRANPLTITMTAATSQNLNPAQICAAIEGANPTSTSSVSLIRMSSTHSDIAMSNLRLRHINSYMYIEKDLQDAYIYTGSMDFYTNAIAVGGEAAVMNLNMECKSAVTGKVRGLIINVYGNGLPATSMGLEVRVDGSTAATLGEGIRIWTLGGNAITRGIDLRGNIKTLIEGISTLTGADQAVHYTVSDTYTGSGAVRGIHVQMTKTSGVISGAGTFSGIASDIQVKANVSNAYAINAYTGIATTPTIGYMSAYHCYCDDLGSANVNYYTCANFNIDSTNEATNGNYFIRMYAHGAAPTAAFYFPSSVGIDNLFYFEQSVAPVSATSETGNATLKIACKYGGGTKYLRLYDD